jgi:hypothetical protein
MALMRSASAEGEEVRAGGVLVAESVVEGVLLRNLSLIA